MSAFDKFYKRKDVIKKKWRIEESSYNKLMRASESIYEASVNQLVNAAIKELIKTEEIKLRNMKDKDYVARSFQIEEVCYEQLYNLKEKYKISINLLVNIAIENALQKDKNISEEHGIREELEIK